MTREYKEVIQLGGATVITYEENGFLVSFPKDAANSDYQAYLDKDKPKAELSTPIVKSDGE